MQSLPVAILALILCAALIYRACEYFVNGIEWVGVKAGFTQNAVGTVLAAFGTALPESVVTFVAVVFGRDAASRDIGVGAALGGPLVLATIAYPVVGLMLLLTRSQPAARPIEVNRARLCRDQVWFLLIFACKIALGLLTFARKAWLGWLFLAAYAGYTRAEMRDPGEDLEGAPEPLKFQPRVGEPGWRAVGAQTLLALIVIFVASHLFVQQLEVIGPWIGMRPAVIALLLSPIATELPETMNAIIWIRQGKHRLALSNISGSMMVQATVPTALGLFFTPWLLGPVLVLAAGLTAAAIGGLWILLQRNSLTPARLAAFAALYLAFALASVLI